MNTVDTRHFLSHVNALGECEKWNAICSTYYRKYNTHNSPILQKSEIISQYAVHVQFSVLVIISRTVYKYSGESHNKKSFSGIFYGEHMCGWVLPAVCILIACCTMPLKCCLQTYRSTNAQQLRKCSCEMFTKPKRINVARMLSLFTAHSRSWR